jgi:hypothetical protein
MKTLYFISPNKLDDTDFKLVKLQCDVSIVLLCAREEYATLAEHHRQLFSRILIVEDATHRESLPWPLMDFASCKKCIFQDVLNHNVERPVVFTQSEDYTPLVLDMQHEFNQIPKTTLPQEHWDIFKDKVSMKSFMSENGIPTPKFVNLGGLIEIKQVKFESLAKTLGKPFIIKPLSEAGSYEVNLIKTETDLLDLQHRLEKTSCEINFQAESYLDGELFHCDFLVSRTHIEYEACGRYLHPVMECRKGKPFGSIMLPEDHSEFHTLMSVARRALATLQVNTAAVHMELFLTKEGNPVFLEMGLRPPGVKTMNRLQDMTLFTLSLLHVISEEPVSGKSIEANQSCGWVWVPAHSSGYIKEKIPTLNNPYIKHQYAAQCLGDAVTYGFSEKESFRALLKVESHPSCYDEINELIAHAVDSKHIKIGTCD